MGNVPSETDTQDTKMGGYTIAKKSTGYERNNAGPNKKFKMDGKVANSKPIAPVPAPDLIDTPEIVYHIPTMTRNQYRSNNINPIIPADSWAYLKRSKSEYTLNANDEKGALQVSDIARSGSAKEKRVALAPIHKKNSKQKISLESDEPRGDSKGTSQRIGSTAGSTHAENISKGYNVMSISNLLDDQCIKVV